MNPLYLGHLALSSSLKIFYSHFVIKNILIHYTLDISPSVHLWKYFILILWIKKHIYLVYPGHLALSSSLKIFHSHIMNNWQMNPLYPGHLALSSSLKIFHSHFVNKNKWIHYSLDISPSVHHWKFFIVILWIKNKLIYYTLDIST